MMMDMGNIRGTGWIMMGGMGVIWLLIATALILGVLALFRYLGSAPADRRAFEPHLSTNPPLHSETAEYTEQR